MEKNKEWRAVMYSVTGRLHQEKNLQSQDRVWYGKGEQLQSLSLVDGNGRTDRNAKVCEEIVECVGQFLLEVFEDMQQEEEERIQRALYIRVREIIEASMDKYKLPDREFASTILGVVIDWEREIYCSLHLGDGLILCRGENYRILSYPFNGVRRNQTYLTTSPEAWREIRVERGSLRDISELVLMTDGAYELPLSIEVLEKTVKEIKKTGKPKIPGPVDDLSIVMLCRS